VEPTPLPFAIQLFFDSLFTLSLSIILFAIRGCSPQTLALDKSRLSCTIVYVNIIADTNIFLAIALEEPEKEFIIEMTSESDAHSPEILPYEIGNALTAMIKRKQISRKEALSAFEITRNIPVRLIPADIHKALEIAMKFNIYAYDAYFIQVAQYMDCPLLTLDKKLKEVAEKLNISLLE